MLAAGDTAQELDQFPAGDTQDVGDDLGRKGVAFHAGDLQRLLQDGRQAADAPADDRLHTDWQRFPVNDAILRPAPKLVLNESPALLHVVQQLYGKEGMTARALEQLGAEGFGQPIGFAVQQRIDKCPVHLGCRLAQADLDVAVTAHEHLQQRRERVRFCLFVAVAGDGARIHFTAAVAPQEQNTAAGQPHHGVEKERCGCMIDPLQVVDQQQQRLAFRKRAQELSVLLKQPALRRFLWLHRSLRQRVELNPATVGSDGMREDALLQTRAGHENIDQIWALLEQHLGGVRQQCPEPARLIPAEQG